MNKLLSLLLCLSFSFPALGVEVRANHSYEISNGSIETTSGLILDSGRRLRVNGFRGGWAVEFQLLDDNLRPTGETLVASKRWLEEAVRDLSIDDLVAVIQRQNQIIESSTTVENCPPISSLRPEPRPTDLMERFQATQPARQTPSDINFKSQSEMERYFSCWRKTDRLMGHYRDRYKASIENASRSLSVSTSGELSEREVTTVMSCLIHRESAHWLGDDSDTGAPGLAQIIGDARQEVRDYLSFSPRSDGDSWYDRRIQIQRDENAAGRLSRRELASNIASIEAERTNYLREAAVHNLWNNIPLRSRPSSGQISEAYVRNNANHQSVIALSSLIVKNCMIRLKDSGYEMSPQMTLFACSGAYNMGVGGFMNNALSRRGPQNLETWIRNLRASGSSQANETINHLISINRCINGNQNYPPCGTDSSWCKESGMPTFNACTDRPDPMCIGEITRCNQQ